MSNSVVIARLRKTKSLNGSICLQIFFVGISNSRSCEVSRFNIPCQHYCNMTLGWFCSNG